MLYIVKRLKVWIWSVKNNMERQVKTIMMKCILQYMYSFEFHVILEECLYRNLKRILNGL